MRILDRLLGRSAHPTEEIRSSEEVIILADGRQHRLFRGPQRPTQAALDTIVKSATRVEVFKRGSSITLHETAIEAELADLHAALRIYDAGIGRSGGMWDQKFIFWRDETLLGEVMLYHGISLCWDAFFDHAPLLDSGLILDWFDARGVREVREQYEAEQRRLEELKRQAVAQAAYQKWFLATPACLIPHTKEMAQIRQEWTEQKRLLDQHHPDAKEQALILLEWYGQGAGSWLCAPPYESVPEWCLLQLPLDALIAAAQSRAPSQHLLEGASRLFCSAQFASKLKSSGRYLPSQLKRTLLAHCLESEDTNKRERANQVFGSS